MDPRLRQRLSRNSPCVGSCYSEIVTCNSYSEMSTWCHRVSVLRGAVGQETDGKYDPCCMDFKVANPKQDERYERYVCGTVEREQRSPFPVTAFVEHAGRRHGARGTALTQRRTPFPEARWSQLSTPRQSSLLVTWACMFVFSNSATVKCRCHSLGFLLCHREYTSLHKRYIKNY